MNKSSLADVKSALGLCSEQLKDCTDNPISEARLLLSFVLDKPQSWLIAWPESTLDNSQFDTLQQLLSRRKNGEPLAYITGVRDFWSLSLKVSPDTLIPRADTEVLVETALKLIDQSPPGSILDLGTGTGAIALALASEYPNIEILATDFSHAALAIAKQNHQSLNCPNVNFLQSDWFATIPTQRFDIIVSNPPYIAENDEHLRDKGLKYEPISALTSGADGLDDIRQIISTSKDWLSEHGHIALEHGYNQASSVQTLLIEAGFIDVRSVRDYAGNERVTFARR